MAESILDVAIERAFAAACKREFVKENSASGRSRRIFLTEADFANLSLLKPHAALERVLERASVVGSDGIAPDVVTMNSHVVLRDPLTGERVRTSVVYPEDADASAGRISVLETAGMQLLGASPGQTIAWNCSDGARELRVEKVVYQPEHSLRTFLVVRG